MHKIQFRSFFNLEKAGRKLSIPGISSLEELHRVVLTQNYFTLTV